MLDVRRSANCLNDLQGSWHRVVSKVSLCFALLALSACANHESARLLQEMDVAAVERYYVAKFEPDGRGINDLIRDDLAGRGYRVTTGPEALMPGDTNILVTYWDKWMWDITMYMIELDVTFRNPKTREPIAIGNSMHASLTRRSPSEMVQEVLDNIFEETNARVSSQ